MLPLGFAGLYNLLASIAIANLPTTSTISAEQPNIIQANRYQATCRTPEVFKRMEKNIHDVEAQAEAAMTEWESSPEDQALKAAYKKSRNLLETLRKEEWRKKLLYMDAAVIAARECSPLLS